MSASRNEYRRWHLALLLFTTVAVAGISNVEAQRGGGGRGGGGGGARAAAHGSVNHQAHAGGGANRSAQNVNRNENVNRNVNRDVNRNTNVNVNRDVHVDVDSHNGWNDWDHPVAAAAAVTTAVAVTSAVIGSIVYSVPPSCVSTVVNGVAYQQCGSTWYQPQYSGTNVQYVVVNAP
jgi:hypothetical protein